MDLTDLENVSAAHTWIVNVSDFLAVHVKHMNPTGLSAGSRRHFYSKTIFREVDSKNCTTYSAKTIYSYVYQTKTPGNSSVVLYIIF